MGDSLDAGKPVWAPISGKRGTSSEATARAFHSGDRKVIDSGDEIRTTPRFDPGDGASIEDVEEEQILSPDIMNPWPPRFLNKVVEKKYLYWGRKTYFPDLWVTVLVIIMIVGSMIMYLSFEVAEPDNHDHVYTVKLALACSAATIAILTLLLAPPNIEQMVYVIGLSTSGVMLALSTTFGNDTIGSFIGAETIMAYVGLLTSMSSIVTYTSLSTVSAMTILAYFILGIVFLGDTENEWATMHSLVTLITMAAVLHIISYESEVGSRGRFYRRWLIRADTQRQSEKVRKLKREKKELMMSAFSDMLKRLDLAKVDDDKEQRVFQSPAEELMTTISELCTQNLGAVASRVLKDVRRIVRRSGGDLYQPLREDLDALQDSGQSDMIQVLVQRNRKQRILEMKTGEQHRLGSPRRKFKTISFAMGSAEDRSVEHLYNTIDDFDFDIFDVMEPTKNRPLAFVVLALFGKHGLVSQFSVDLKKLRAFCEVIEKGYISSNPYHNEIHGADVTRSCHFLLHAGGAFRIMTPLETMAAIIASCIHDFQHPGVTNDFLIQTSGDLAVTYNDQSVLENHHIAAAFRHLLRPELNFLEHLTAEEYKEFRKIVVVMVLATDLSRHKENLDKLKLRTNHLRRLLHPRRSEMSPISCRPAMSITAASGSSVATNLETDEKEEAEDRLMILKTVLKASDLGHVMKPLRQHIIWSNRIKDEFFLEGDMAKTRGIKVKPLFDREQNKDMGKSQAGFIQFLVMPLYRGLIPLLRLEDPVLKQIHSNLSHWKKEEERFRIREKKIKEGKEGQDDEDDVENEQSTPALKIKLVAPEGATFANSIGAQVAAASDDEIANKDESKNENLLALRFESVGVSSQSPHSSNHQSSKDGGIGGQGMV
mmetsp:Transcript_26506/g.36938  ORF Transcript_26506/g.36938 Transcript_26506/m.36938 type:complete len:881 (+) Transcript_26506:501-3143(+)